jgi:hypothetical protein
MGLGRGLALVALAVACGRGESSRLPATRPADFALTVAFGEGMTARGWQLDISAAGGALVEMDNANTDRGTFPVSAADLDALYATCRAQRVDAIRTHEEEVSDRGGTSLHITADGRSFQISDSGMSFVAEADRPRFAAIVEAAQALASKGRLPVAIAFDPSLAGHDLQILRTGQLEFLGVVAADQTASLTLLAGEHELVLHSNTGAHGRIKVDPTRTPRLRARLDGDAILVEPVAP